MISINEFRSLVVTIYLDPPKKKKKKKKKKAQQSKNANAHVHSPQNPLVVIFLCLVSGQLDKGIMVVVVVVRACTCHIQSRTKKSPNLSRQPQAKKMQTTFQKDKN